MLIFTRRNRYLTARYRWGQVPHLFHSWQFDAVVNILQRERGVGVAVVDGNVIDLDTLEIERIT